MIFTIFITSVAIMPVLATIGLGDKISANANLGLLLDNGGPTMTHALVPGSDAINTGNPAGCEDSDGNLFTADQRGVSRPQGVRCDIGAYELEVVARVGGVTSFSGGSGSSAGSIALLAGGIAAAVAITAIGWYTRRRWLGSRS